MSHAKQNTKKKKIVYRNMSSNYLKIYAIFLDFVIFVITVKLLFGILKCIFLKGSPGPHHRSFEVYHT